MRHALSLAAMLLPLGACYVSPPGPPAYAQPGYPPPGPGYGYAQPGYPPPPVGYDPYGNVYPGYSYNDGSPTLFVDGAVMPLILFGGGWGYWDSRHEWHRAPDAVSHHLEQQRASGGFRPGGARLEGGRPPGGATNGGQAISQPRAVPAAVSRPAPPARQERERGRDCPPGQRC